MVHILQTLEVLLPGKINYDEPPDDADDSDSHDPDSEKFSLQGMYSHYKQCKISLKPLLLLSTVSVDVLTKKWV